MTASGAGNEQQVKLNVASWGPDLDVKGITVDPSLNRQNSNELGLQGFPSQQVPSRASAICTPRSAELGGSEDPVQSPGRRHNLRPRAELNSILHALGEDGDDDDYGEGVGEAERDAGDDSDERTTRSGKKKVGRPIAYTGDPDSPNLTEAERRRLRRRVANRESARRVRNKRQDTMEQLQRQVSSLQDQNQQLTSHIAGVEQSKESVLHDIQELRAKWEGATEQNTRLRAEVASMRQQLHEQQDAAQGLPARSSALPGFAMGVLNQGESADQHVGQANSQDQTPMPSALPETGSGFDISGLMQLSPMPSREIPGTAGGSGMQRQSSVQPPPDLAPLPDIQPLTGLQQLAPLYSPRPASHCDVR